MTSNHIINTPLTPDLLDRNISVDDYVVFHNSIYRILETRGYYVKMILLNPSKSTKPVTKYSKQCCIIPKGDVTFWLLKKS